MSRSIFSHNKFHLGDCLQSLHLLRSLAKQQDQTPFVFFTNGCNLLQLREVVTDLPNIILADFESPLWQERQHESVDMWKNHDHFWENSRSRWDWSQFMLSHHDWTAARMELLSPFKVREHLLLDYPALEKDPGNLGEFDFLIGDSKPCSGQFSPMADHTIDHLAPLLNSLLKKGHRITCTEISKAQGNNVSRIGVLSQKCKHSIMVANAPFFCTLNVHNHHSHEGRRRIVLLDNGETLNMPYIIQMSSVDEVLRFAKEEKWI